MQEAPSIKQWLTQFCFVNGCFLLLINFYNLSHVGTIQHIATLIGSYEYLPVYLFDGLTLMGQSALMLVPVLAIGYLSLWFGRRHPTSWRLLLCCIMGLFLLFLTIDSYCFRLYHYHINGLLLKILLSNDLEQFLALSQIEWLSLLGLLCGLLLFECSLGLGLWRWQVRSLASKNHYLSMIFLIAIGCAIASYLAWFFAQFEDNKDPRYLLKNQVLRIHARAYAFFTLPIDLLPKSMLMDRLFHLNGSSLFYQDDAENKHLSYPKHPLHCTPKQTPYNVVIIGADAWRSDMLNAEVTPNPYAFAQNNLYFKNHFSGGNCTKAGLFSLFYSLPVNYWNAMLKTQQGPLLLHEFLQQNYQLGIFTSARNDIPPYNKTLYVEDKNLVTQTAGDIPMIRDQHIVRHFQHFLDNYQTKPFFSFVFFNTSHSYCEAGHYPNIFKPSIKQCNRIELGSEISKQHKDLYFNRYKNALHYVDTLIGEVLASLKQRHLLNNTIVILTGDHGEEFDDNHQNFWGHTGNFSNTQLMTPLVVHWPNHTPKYYTQVTTHFDIAPTLMHQVLGCQNPEQDYALGHSLFSIQNRLPFVVGSYLHTGLRAQDHITEFFPDGQFRVYDLHYQELPLSRAQPQLIQYAFLNQQRFYRKDN